MYILYVQGDEIVSEKSFLFSCIFKKCFRKFYYAIQGRRKVYRSRDVQGVLQGLLKEQVLFLYLVKSGTPSCTGSNPDYNKKHENMDA